MSLQAPLFYIIPDETALVAHAAFPNGNRYMRAIPLALSTPILPLPRSFPITDSLHELLPSSPWSA